MPVTSYPVVETRVNGIRTLVAETPGPLSAELLFRVGAADETFSTHGITHLVEHLVLYREDSGCPQTNGSVSWTTLSLRAVGDGEQVGRFLNGVVTRLRALPLRRIEDERRVLAAEIAQRSPSRHGPLFSYRYGLRDYGLTFLDDLLPRQLAADHVQAWADAHAVAGNAVLLLSGPPPPVFTAELHSGPWRAPPDATRTMIAPRPVWIPGGDEVLLHAVVPRTPAATVAGHVLRRRLHRTLREDRALAYSPTVSYEPMDAGHALVAVRSDADHEPELVTCLLLDTISDLATGRRPARDEEIAAPVALARRAAQLDAERFELARQAAAAVLVGRPVRSPEQLVAEREALTAVDMTEAAAQILADAMVALPPRVDLLPPWQPAPSCVEAPIVRGRSSRSRGRQRQRMVADETGVTLTPADSPPVTIRAERAVAVLRRADGARIVLGEDGCELRFDPALWEDGEALGDSIDRVFAGVPAIADNATDPTAVPLGAADCRPGWLVTAAVGVVLVAVALGCAAFAASALPTWLLMLGAGAGGALIGWQGTGGARARSANVPWSSSVAATVTSCRRGRSERWIQGNCHVYNGAEGNRGGQATWAQPGSTS